MDAIKSQTQEIEEYLKKGNSLTPIEALEKFGCFRLGARIYDLKDKGYEFIVTTVIHGKKRYAQYKMKLKPIQQKLF